MAPASRANQGSYPNSRRRTCGPHQHGLLPTSRPAIAQPPSRSPGALVPSKAPAYHGFQAADLILCPVEQLLPVPLLLEQQLGPPAREATSSALAVLQGRASSPTMLAPRQCPLLFPAVPQQLPGQSPLPLQLLCDPLLVLPQLVSLLLQLLGKQQGCSPVSAPSIRISPGCWSRHAQEGPGHLL